MLNKRLASTIVCLSSVILALCTASAYGEMSQLYGEWEGTWNVDEKYNSSGSPVGSPPYAVEEFWVFLQAFDGDDYGYLAFDASYPSGDVVELSMDQNANVTMAIDYSPYSSISSDPAYYAYITGVLDGTSIVGNFDESYPAAPGWIFYRGPAELNKVPEPATVGLLTLGGLALLRRRRAA